VAERRESRDEEGGQRREGGMTETEESQYHPGSPDSPLGGGAGTILSHSQPHSSPAAQRFDASVLAPPSDREGWGLRARQGLPS